MKEQFKTPEKRAKQNGNKQSIRYRVQNTGYKDSQETQWILQQHKETQTEMKYILIEIKNNLQGNKGRVDEAKIQINDLEH